MKDMMFKLGASTFWCGVACGAAIEGYLAGALTWPWALGMACFGFAAAVAVLHSHRQGH